MRIDRARRRKKNTPIRTGAGARAVKGAFAAELRQSNEQQLKQELAELWQRMEEAGARVRNSLAYADWLEYRQRVEEFLQFVRSTGYRVDVKEGFSAFGSRYSYTVIEAIDKKLHEIGVAFLRENHDRIELMAKLDELRGMLLDLYA